MLARIASIMYAWRAIIAVNSSSDEVTGIKRTQPVDMSLADRRQMGFLRTSETTVVGKAENGGVGSIGRGEKGFGSRWIASGLCRRGWGGPAVQVVH